MKNPKVDTALHIIKGAIQKVLGTKLTTGTFGDESKGRLTVEFDRKPTQDEIDEIERLANAKINEDVPVKIHVLERDAAEKKYGRIIYDKFEVPKHITQLSVLDIENWNLNCCNGKHTKTTGEVGSIKIRKTDFRNSKKELEIGFEVMEEQKLDKDIERRLALIKEVGEEIVTEEELIELLTKKKKFIAYDGFEPSGQIHIAQGILRAINVNKMIKAGAHFKMWVADWFGLLNNKMGGDLNKIRVVGEYFIEVWKASGMDLKNVEFVWTSEFIKEHPEYWETVMKLSMNSTIQRVLRCGQIMGREESLSNPAAQVLYPLMQASDIHHLEADIAQLGMDQRKVNMLAREVFPKLGYKKPISISHHMLMGLQQPVSEEKDTKDRAIELKMSKSKPDTAIFMTDTEEDIKRKMGKAWCPEKEVKENPIMEYYRYIVFEKFDTVEIKRPEKFGGDLKVKGYDNLASLYSEGKIHPMDLKNTCAVYINELVDPVRLHFETDARAKKLKEQVASFQVTR